MKPITPGKLLTPDESVRLTVIDSTERQDLIEHIAAQLREAERNKETSPLSPLQWYRRMR
jgi:hypothetical protein